MSIHLIRPPLVFLINRFHTYRCISASTVPRLTMNMRQQDSGGRASTLTTPVLVGSSFIVAPMPTAIVPPFAPPTDERR